ncbi:MAG: cyclase family protein [Flavobacteriales bacterium]|nr:cyclase family protein [Flavobacteriales bacterium]
MKGEIFIKNNKYLIDFSKGKDISIPLLFNGKQPNTYGVQKASSEPYSNENFIGDTRKGGVCNFETYHIVPHCNGTHTECVGHITKERIDVLSSLKDLMIPAHLVSIHVQKTSEKYIPQLNEDDLLITRELLLEKLKDVPNEFMEGLVIRTLPNLPEKKSQNYLTNSSPFFTIDAMEYIKERGVKHLLVDTPSVDRLLDEGILSAHNTFWDTENKKFNPKTKNKTITEMIYVDNQIQDGHYLLTIQIPAFVSDAAPSRPIIFEINEL